MKTDDWNSFGEWLSNLEAEDVWVLNRLLVEYELKNKAIRWLVNEK
jgi:hypothetical protein